MASITTRSGKGSPLTGTEHDANLNNLNNDKAENGANTDITSLGGLTTPLSVDQGGTGAATLTDGGVLLGSGTGAITATAVLADGEMIVGDGTTDPAIESGATLRTSIGVAIGTDVQAYDAGLADIAGLAVTDGNVIVGDGANWVAESGSTARTSIGVVNDNDRYSAVTTTTALAVNKLYNDTSGASNAHTLPLLSGTTAGDRIRLIVTGSNRTVSVSHNASDSSGAEIWTGVAVGDFVDLMSDGTAWQVLDHHESHYCRVYVSADEAVAQGAAEQIVTISETTDIGDIWNTTNDEVDIPFDCWVDLNWQILSDPAASIIAAAKLDTTFIFDPSEASGPSANRGQMSLHVRISASSGEKLELWAFNTDSDSGNSNVAGDAAGDESFATIKLTRRYS